MPKSTATCNSILALIFNATAWADIAENVVGFIILEPKRLTQIMMKGRSVGAEDGVRAGVALREGAQGVAGEVGVAAVEAAADQTLIA